MVVLKKKWADVVTIISGKNQKAVEDSHGKFPIYGSGGPMGYANDYLCDAGTTIVGRKGTINRPIYVNEPFWNVDTAFGISPGSDLLPKYLFFFCCFFNFSALDKSTTIPSLAKRDLLNIEMPVPPLTEQARIVAQIEELFSQLDSGVETLRKTKQQLAVYRQAVLKEAFENPGWPKKKTAEIGDVCLGRQRSPKNVSKDYPTKYIRAANITESGLSLNDVLEMEFTPQEREKYYLKKGDLLISEASGSATQVGKPALWNNNIENCCFQNTVIRLRLTQDFPEYVFWYLKYMYLSGAISLIAGGVGINHLGANNFSNIEIPVPPLEIQKSVVTEIESYMSLYDSINKSVDTALQQAEAMRQSILKQAFEGGL